MPQSVSTLTHALHAARTHSRPSPHRHAFRRLPWAAQVRSIETGPSLLLPIRLSPKYSGG